MTQRIPIRVAPRWLGFISLTVLAAACGSDDTPPPSGSGGGGSSGGSVATSGSGGIGVPQPSAGSGGNSAGAASAGLGGTASGGASGAANAGAGGTTTAGAGGTTSAGTGGATSAGAGGTTSAGAGGTTSAGAGGTTARAQFFADFDDGTSLAPFKTCWAWAPNYAKVIDQSVEFFYSQAAYDANPRREMAGTEICAPFETFTDGWYGFELYLPSPGFPTNTETIVVQVFQMGACNSWAAHLDILNRDLVVQHRSSCGTPTQAVVYPNMPLNTWVPVILYFKASNNGNGAFRVWVNGAPKEAPSYDRTNINFGFGQWTNGTTLAPGNMLTHKMGLYTRAGGDKRIRFDTIALQPGNPPDAYDRVNPQR